MKFAERLQGAADPVVYRTLQHALMQKKLGHAFLFVGQKGTPRMETALAAGAESDLHSRPRRLRL